MTIREIIIDWLTSSRYIRSLEARHQEQRQDYTTIIADKDAQIRLLRVEIASLKLECDRMRTALLPFGSPASAAFMQSYQPKPEVVPAFDGPDDWQTELNKLYEKENNGTHGDGRQEVHQSASDDAA